MRAGDHWDVIFEWKWAQKHCTVNTDVFLHLMALNPRRNAHFCILFCNDARKTLAGTPKKQSTTSQNIGRHQTKKTTIYGGPESWVDAGILLFFAFCWCLPMFCEIVQIVLCFFALFGACASLMSLFDVEKERPYLQCFVLIFIHKSRPHGSQRKSPETVGKMCFAKWPFRFWNRKNSFLGFKI